MRFLADDDPPPSYSKGFWIGLVFAIPVVAYGVRGALDALPGVELTSFLWYSVGAAVVHDLLVGPLVCLVGWLVSRRVPVVARGPVQAALIVSGVVALVSWPFVHGYGITEGEPSFLSRNYTASVLVVWGVAWAAAAATTAVRVFTRRR